MVDINRIGDALMGFSAGAQGNGQAFLANQAVLSDERKKALAEDMQEARMLMDSDPMKAAEFMRGRLPEIARLRGDPKDTQRWLDMIEAGDITGATRELDEGIQAAQMRGYLPTAAKDKFLEYDKETGEAIVQKADGSITAQQAGKPRGKPFKMTPAQEKYAEALPFGTTPETATIGDWMEAKKAFQAATKPESKYSNVDVGKGVALNTETNQLEGLDKSPELLAEEVKAKEEFVESRVAEYKNIIGTIAKSVNLLEKDQKEFFSSTEGTLGKMAEYLPFLDGYDLAQTVKTIQANLSFDKLQAIRESSSTGGGLGSISERELDLLGGALASLDGGLSAPLKRKNLMKVFKHYTGFIKSLNGEIPLPSGVTEEHIADVMEEEGVSYEEVLVYLMDDYGGE